ncbi:hypothetical protein GCM10017714_11940 [Curtobacterium pusillum]|nr:hypothetical protein GCM10017610_07390 [Curtobacterium pusillum]
MRGRSPVEPLGLVPQRGLPVLPDRVHELAGGVHCVRDVSGGTGHESEEFGAGGQATAEVDSLHHQGAKPTEPAAARMWHRCAPLGCRVTLTETP